MSFYLIVFLALFVGTVLEYKQKKTHNAFFLCVFLFMTGLLCLRYGQGTDYFAYESLYTSTPLNLIAAIQHPGLHGEIGWRVICVIFRCLRLPFWTLVFAFSVAEMFFLYQFIRRYCHNAFMALFMAYHTLYMSYFFSALRQGLVTAIFLGLLLNWLLKKKYIKYAIGCVACALVHSAAISLLILPIIYTKLFSQLRWHLILVGAAWAFGAIFATGIFTPLMSKILPGSVLPYLTRDQITLMPIMERIVTYGIVFGGCWIYTKKVGEMPKHMWSILCIVTIGMIAYGGLLWMPLVASRIAYLFKVTEIALFCSILMKLPKRYQQLVVLFVLGLTSVMYAKNVASYIRQGAYSEYINILNYPYVSVFNRGMIYLYRP